MKKLTMNNNNSSYKIIEKMGRGDGVRIRLKVDF